MGAGEKKQVFIFLPHPLSELPLSQSLSVMFSLSPIYSKTRLILHQQVLFPPNNNIQCKST